VNISFSKYFSPSNYFAEGEMRYFINGLENPQDLDIITGILIDQFNANPIEENNGIWFIRRGFEKEGKIFYLYWDEDIGILFVSGEKPVDDWLEQLVKDIIPFIEEKCK
jgi:hypothetical protein